MHFVPVLHKNFVSTSYFMVLVTTICVKICENFWFFIGVLTGNLNDEGSVPEMRIWSILFIKSDLKWCIHLSWSLFLSDSLSMGKLEGHMVLYCVPWRNTCIYALTFWTLHWFHLFFDVILHIWHFSHNCDGVLMYSYIRKYLFTYIRLSGTFIISARKPWGEDNTTQQPQHTRMYCWLIFIAHWRGSLTDDIILQKGCLAANSPFMIKTKYTCSTVKIGYLWTLSLLLLAINKMSISC